MHSQRKIVFKHPNYQAMFIFHVNCFIFSMSLLEQNDHRKKLGEKIQGQESWQSPLKMWNKSPRKQIIFFFVTFHCI